MNDAVVKIPLSQIPVANYTGYLWPCDQHKPIVLFDEPIPEQWIDSSWPFIQEGWLFDPTTQQSVYITYQDSLQCYVYNLRALQEKANIELIPRLYYAHHQMSHKENLILQFYEVWIPQTDPLCEGMSVLRPTAMIFGGFYKK